MIVQSVYCGDDDEGIVEVMIAKMLMVIELESIMWTSYLYECCSF